MLDKFVDEKKQTWTLAEGYLFDVCHPIGAEPMLRAPAWL